MVKKYMASQKETIIGHEIVQKNTSSFLKKV